MDTNNTIITNKKKYLNKEFILEWTSTFIILTGVLLTNLDMRPYNLIISLIGCIGWLILSILWKKYSLMLIQIILIIFYSVGIIIYFI